MWSLVLTLIMFLVSFMGVAASSVYIVLMEDDPFIMMSVSGSDMQIHKDQMTKAHDIFLKSLLEEGSYNKLYSYTYLLNGFAIYIEEEWVLDLLQGADRVRSVHKEIKLEKCTTHTPDFLNIRRTVWPALGGSDVSGEGVVIGLIDTGINPSHPSFASTNNSIFSSKRFRGNCVTGDGFPASSCNGKIVGARYYARSASVGGEFNSTRDYASPFDADGHGSHTASIAAGNHNISVISNNFNYGYASGMAPGARIAIYKALYSFGGYMSDVVAAIDQAVEDGVDILSLSIAPTNVPSGPTTFLSILELQLLFATKAGVLVVQAIGNGGPSPSSIVSFSPWINSVAASMTDRNYNTALFLRNGRRLVGTGLAPPTTGGFYFPMAAAADVCLGNFTAGVVDSCQRADPFIRRLARGKLVICRYTFDFEDEAAATVVAVADTIRKIGAVGFILAMDPDIGTDQIKDAPVTLPTLPVPGVILNDLESSSALWEYYNSHTLRNRNERAIVFGAIARILDGRQATYNEEAPAVASYSSRGPDVYNSLLGTADVLKPNIMAPGSSIWAAWTPNSEGDHNIKGQHFALLSGTSMATPHIAGIAALIKQKHPHWSPSAIISSMMTTADVYDNRGAPIMASARHTNNVATPFDFGAGSINPSKAMDPGLVFKTYFHNYIQFLCAVPGVNDTLIRRAVGVECPQKKRRCSDLNTASVTVSNLTGSRKVIRHVTNVGDADEMYRVIVREPAGVNITITPQAFNITVNSTRDLIIVLQPTQQTNAYTFGEIILEGRDINHVVRVPISINVSSL